MRTKRRGARAGGMAAAITIPALLVAARIGAEDVIIVSKTRFGDKAGAQTVYLAPTRMKTAGGGGDSIFEFETGRMTFLDEGKKTYYVTSVEEMAAYAKRREEQARTSGFNAQAFGELGEVSVRKTGKTRKIAGYTCDGWVVAMGEALILEVCAARLLPVPPAYFDARKAAYAGMGPMGRHFERVFEAMRAVRGYPLSLTMHVQTEGMKQETLTEATEVRKGAIPADTFAVPAGYVKKKSPFKS